MKPSEAPEPCCGDYFNCQRPCTPRGREIEKRQTAPIGEPSRTDFCDIKIADLEKRLKGIRHEHDYQFNRANKLQNEVRFMNEIKDGAVWYWQGDGEDYPDSLACAVVMRPEHLRELLGAAKRNESTRNAVIEECAVAAWLWLVKNNREQVGVCDAIRALSTGAKSHDR